MNATRAKLLIAGTAVAVGGLLAAAYLFRFSPFNDGTGKIAASAVCESLGPSSQSLPALKSVLPKNSSYAFDDDVTLRVDDGDDSYGSACSVAGGRQELMSARTQMMRAEPGASWVDGEIQQYAKGSDQLTSFEA
ncbi:hypothetical protein ACFVYF_35755 [Streptomyces sp. NPDC058274]|uniref:hypothetical protein n=1 Tax=Streptomyces sp. NPDC058274 TaxID=3346416 RepID=UPI0036EFAE08